MLRGTTPASTTPTTTPAAASTVTPAASFGTPSSVVSNAPWGLANRPRARTDVFSPGGWPSAALSSCRGSWSDPASAHDLSRFLPLAQQKARCESIGVPYGSFASTVGGRNVTSRVYSASSSRPSTSMGGRPCASDDNSDDEADYAEWGGRQSFSDSRPSVPHQTEYQHGLLTPPSSAHSSRRGSTSFSHHPNQFQQFHAPATTTPSTTPPASPFLSSSFRPQFAPGPATSNNFSQAPASAPWPSGVSPFYSNASTTPGYSASPSSYGYGPLPAPGLSAQPGTTTTATFFGPPNAPTTTVPPGSLPFASAQTASTSKSRRSRMNPLEWFRASVPHPHSGS